MRKAPRAAMVRLDRAFQARLQQNSNFWRDPYLLWIGIGATIAGLIALLEIDALLGAIESSDGRAFGHGVLVGFKFAVWDTSTLEEALELWRASGAPVERFIVAHALIDLFVLMPGYFVVFVALLTRLEALPRVVFVAGAAVTADLFETLVTLLFLRDLEAGTAVLVAVQLATFAKWLLIAFLFVSVAVLLVRKLGPGPDEDARPARPAGRASQVQQAPLPNAYRSLRRGFRGGREPVLWPLLPIGLLVAAFAFFVATPGDNGVTAQLPDSLRQQVVDISQGELWVPALSTLALAALAAAVAVGALTATDPATSRAQTGTLASGWVLGGALAISLAFAGLTLAAGADPGAASFAPLLVTGAIFLASLVARLVGLPLPEPAPRRTADELPAGRAMAIAALTAVVVIAGGVGLVRAALPPLLTDTSGPTGWMALALFLGLVTASLGGAGVTFALQRREQLARRSPGTVKIAQAALAALVGAAVLALAIWPEQSRHAGTTGAIALGVAAYALLFGMISWLSHWMRPWSAIVMLRLGRRTPWLAIVLLTWLVANLLNRTGGYHDARVAADLGPVAPQHESLAEAFDEWLAAYAPGGALSGCRVEGEPVPMVFVAVPGGGIRAAYWGTIGLEALFGATAGDEACPGPAPFLVSAISGGTVGTVTWLAATDAGEPPEPRIRRMADDRALAATFSGVFLRDIPQSFIGADAPWRDRAAIMEDEWVASSGDVFSPGGEPLTWSALGASLPWNPVLVAGGASVTDGCRVVMSNTASLAASATGDCFAAIPGGGPVTGAIDPLPALLDRDEGDACEDAATGAIGIRAITIALLSARFPGISPTGGLVSCAGDAERATHVVDGGYYEGSGILSAIEIFIQLEPAIRAHNESAGDGDICVEPWFVVLASGYRAGTAVGHGAIDNRPNEALAPLVAYLDDSLSSRRALEQAAALHLGRMAIPCAGEPPAEFAPRVVAVTPRVAPEVAASLGWVLSEASMANMRRQLDLLLSAGDDGPLGGLLCRLGRHTDPEACPAP